jgi:2-iminobutanoate/2-iminopropanoate deaminase
MAAGGTSINNCRRKAVPKQIITSGSAPTTGFTDRQTPAPIAQAIRFGNMLFVSGQGPLNPATREVVAGDITVQARQTLDNLLGVLRAAGATLANVVNMRVILRNVADFPQFNAAFREYVGSEKVTRTCVGGTPHRTGVNIEIDCIAMFD